LAGGIGDNPVIRRTLLEEFHFVRAYAGVSLASPAPLYQSTERRERLLGACPADVQKEIEAFTKGGLEGKALEAATEGGHPVNEDWRPISEYYLGLQLRQRSSSSTSTAVAR